MGFPQKAQLIKNLPAAVGDLSDLNKRSSGEGEGHLLQYFSLRIPKGTI